MEHGSRYLRCFYHSLTGRRFVHETTSPTCFQCFTSFRLHLSLSQRHPSASLLRARLDLPQCLVCSDHQCTRTVTHMRTIPARLPKYECALRLTLIPATLSGSVSLPGHPCCCSLRETLSCHDSARLLCSVSLRLPRPRRGSAPSRLPHSFFPPPRWLPVGSTVADHHHHAGALAGVPRPCPRGEVQGCTSLPGAQLTTATDKNASLGTQASGEVVGVAWLAVSRRGSVGFTFELRRILDSGPRVLHQRSETICCSSRLTTTNLSTESKGMVTLNVSIFAALG